MRGLRAVILALGILGFSAASRAQDTPTAAPSSSAGLPKAPLPYNKIRPKTTASKPKPKAASPAPTAAASPTPAPPVAIAPKPAAPPAVAATASAPRPTAPLATTAATPVAAAPPEALPARIAGARLAPGQPIPPAEAEAFVDGWMDDAMSRLHVAGATVAVVQNGQVVLKKGYGFADRDKRRPVDPDRTLFRIASISKTFTWILLMKEVEAGRIRLDRPVNLYLPERVRVRDDGMRRPVLVRNLLDHSGGFEDRALGQLFERDARRVRPLDLYLRQERPGRVREPGILSSYSNYGAALAGETTAFVSGKTFERRVEEEITGPLGMRRTTFREPRAARRGLPAPMSPTLAADLATGYLWRGTSFKARPFEFAGHIAPAASASTTAADISRYMLMLLGDGSWNGVTVFGPGAARAFRSPLQQVPPGMNGWAHGFITWTLPGGFKGYGHDGDTIAFHSRMIVVPQLNLGVFVSTNTDSGAELAGAFSERLVRRFYGTPMIFPRTGSRELAERGDAYKGYFLSTRRAYSGLEGFVDQVISGAHARVSGDGRLILQPNDGPARAFVPEGPLDEGRFIDANGEGRAFVKFHDGRAQSYRVGSNAVTFERAPFWRRPEAMLWLTVLSAAAAISTLVGLVFRNRRDLRENPIQSRAGIVQNIQAALWLTAIALMAAFSDKASDVASIFFSWPGAMIVTASTCALVAAALNLLTFAALPAVWQGGRRVDSWPVIRKLFFTVTVLVYGAFAILIGMWGGLAPWAG